MLEIFCYAGVLVNLEGSGLASAKGNFVVAIVTSVAEVLSRDVAGMLVARNGVMNGGAENQEKMAAEAEVFLFRFLYLYKIILE